MDYTLACGCTRTVGIDNPSFKFNPKLFLAIQAERTCRDCTELPDIPEGSAYLVDIIPSLAISPGKLSNVERKAYHATHKGECNTIRRVLTQYLKRHGVKARVLKGSYPKETMIYADADFSAYLGHVECEFRLDERTHLARDEQEVNWHVVPGPLIPGEFLDEVRGLLLDAGVRVTGMKS